MRRTSGPRTRHDLLLSCQAYVLESLLDQATQRGTDENWEHNERVRMAAAASVWGVVNGVPSQVTVEDIERIEYRAVGHFDYASKIALYIAEMVVPA